MTDNEILARIASDVADVGNGMFGVRDITIAMTKELFTRLSQGPHIILSGTYDSITTLFGCKIKVIPRTGLWWIVGFEGTAEEANGGNVSNL